MGFLNLTKQFKIILLSILILTLLGGVGYGGWRYWESKQIMPEAQEPPVEEPTEEKAYEIIDNPDGSHTFICYKCSYKLTYPDSWENIGKHSDAGFTAGWAEFVRRGNIPKEAIHISFYDFSVGSYVNFRDYLVKTARTEMEDIPTEPNITVSKIAGYAFRSDAGGEGNLLIIAIEKDDRAFKIYLPWEKRDDPEYLSVLNSFEFID